jgi:hypothetical protein
LPLLAVPLAVLVALAVPAAAGESKSDKAILKAGVISRDDVPAGWNSKKASGGDNSFKGIPECKTINSAIESAKKRVPRARSREFEEPDSRGTTSAENTVYAFKDVTAASKFVANFQGDVASTCLEKSLAKTTSGRSGAGTPTLAAITDLQGVGDEAVGYESTIPFTASGETATFYLDFIAVRVGRAFVGFGFSNLGERISDGPGIVQAVVARVADAQASA